MNTQDILKLREREQLFLRQQLETVERTLARTQDALTACGDCLENEGLQGMLHAAELERDILRDLLKHQIDNRSLSLDALVLQRMQCAERLSTRLSHNWRRGRPVPDGYWEAQSTHDFLARLLREFHAWQGGRPLYGLAAGTNGQRTGSSLPPLHERVPSSSGDRHEKHFHPWFLPRQSSSKTDPPRRARPDEDELDALREAILEELEAHCFDRDYFEIVAQPDGAVLVKGYVHNETERDDALETIMDVAGVQELLADIHILAPGEEPPRRSDPDQAVEEESNPQAGSRSARRSAE